MPWARPATESQLITAAAERTSGKAAARAPQDVLRDQLLLELQQKDPGVALTHLQQEIARRPTLAKHCVRIARALGKAAVAKYAGSAARAQAYSRPVCDTSFASGVAASR